MWIWNERGGHAFEMAPVFDNARVTHGFVRQLLPDAPDVGSVIVQHHANNGPRLAWVHRGRRQVLG